MPPLKAFAAIIAGALSLLSAREPAAAQRRSALPDSAEISIKRFPARIPTSGAVALHVQILLDRANFSPGIIDGEWGVNAGKALAYFAEPGGHGRFESAALPALSRIDEATYRRIRAAAGPEPLLRRYAVTTGDISGPFVDIPPLVYDQAKLRCLCYSTAAEAIAERFHTSTKLIARLNPRVKLNDLAVGTNIIVPNVERTNIASPLDTVIIAKLVISKKGFWMHVVDDAGRIVYHFPSTLGAGYDPSPTGELRVTHVARNPAFRYQPKLFAEVPDDEPEALLPPGPNSPVGVVWMSLSKPHYGIHGTSSPETIGYANSHGCVRLTNWDALRLSDVVESGTRVEFH